MHNDSNLELVREKAHTKAWLDRVLRFLFEGENQRCQLHESITHLRRQSMARNCEIYVFVDEIVAYALDRKSVV